MEFDRSIKNNNVKFDFVKGNNINKKHKKEENPKVTEENSKVTEGFIDSKKAFEVKSGTFNIVVCLSLIIFVPLIGINGILLFHRYASFKEEDWNGIARNENNDNTGTWLASNIYNDTSKDNKSDVDSNTDSNADNNSNKYTNWYATNNKKHINPMVNYLPIMKEDVPIQSKYDKAPEKESSWGVAKGFTHELSDTFDFYRGLIKTFANADIDKNNTLRIHLQNKINIPNTVIPEKGFGGDDTNLIWLFIRGIIVFIIGLLLSCLAPIVSFIFGCIRLFSDGSGFGPLSISGEIIGLIGANLVSCLMPFYFLFYTIIFPIMDTGDKSKPSYWEEFKCLLTNGSSAIPTIAISLLLIWTTLFLGINTNLPGGPVPIYIGGVIAAVFIMMLGILKIHK